MAGLNKAMVIGNLGKDPELRTTGSGKSVCNFSVATNESWKDASGEKQERTEWHRIVVWGPQAEACGKYLAKGRQVYVEGRIQSREWEDNDGNKKYTTEIIANSVVFLSDGGGKGKSGGRQEPPPIDDTDDIPF